MKTWNLIDAQDHLDEIFNRAIDHHPQFIRADFVGGQVVVLSEEDYVQLVTDHLIESVKRSSLAANAEGDELETDRPTDQSRDTDLDRPNA